MTFDSTVVRIVLRDFRYATLEPLLGRQFTISDHERLRDELVSLGHECSPDAALLHEGVGHFYLQIAKYRFLDVGYRVPSGAFEVDYQSGKQLLRELGFGSGTADGFAELFPEFKGMVPNIAAEVQKGDWYLMVFAKLVEPRASDDVFQRIKETKNLALLPLPGEFKITDACVTNSSYAWFAKHFYV